MDSQYSSNAVPDSLEVACIKLEIAQLANTIRHLQSQLRERKSQLRQRLGAISSVRRVPLEILGEIFGLALPEKMDWRGRGRLVNLCLVCKAWGDAALLKHRLWSNVSIEASASVSYDSITTWLSRSGNVPRCMEVGAHCCNSAYTQEPCKLGQSTLARLLTEGVSLDRLIVWSTGTQCLATMMAALEARNKTRTSTARPWDSIRVLCLFFYYFWNEPADPSKSVFLHIPASVKSLELSTPYVESDVESEQAPFHFPATILQGLTSFDFRLSRPGTRIFSTIQHCVNVQTLILSLDCLPMRYDPDDPFIRHISQFGLLLPKVHTLRLKSHPAESTEFFDFLRTPSLRELDIGFDTRTFLGLGDLAPALENFVKKSGCEKTLRTLRLETATTNGEELAAVLLALPFLTHVTLEDFNFKAHVLGMHLRAAADVDEKPGLPRLEVLDVLRVSPEFEFEELLEFLEDRQFICRGLCDDWQDGFTTLTMTYQQPVVKVPKVDFWSPENLQRARRLGASISFGQVNNPRQNET